MLLLLLLGLIGPLTSANGADDLLAKARQALADGHKEEALQLATQAIAKEGNNPDAHYFRGVVHGALRRHAEAVADLDRALRLKPGLALAYHQRGCERFKLGRFKESVEDFDQYLELAPRERGGHWQRGISLYYAGRFEEGKKQFESYEQVDPNDVENAVWHFLCNARAQGVEKARAQLLKIGRDQRVPMMEVYALFAGRTKPEDVLAAAEAGQASAELRKRQRFYAHLYLGLYWEVMKEPKRTLEHLKKAAEEHLVDHYM
jgi:lipoprotein NlpI